MTDQLPKEWPIDEDFDFEKHGESLGLCGECADPKVCYRFKVCTSLLDAYDISTEEIEGNKLRIIRAKRITPNVDDPEPT